MTAPRCDGVVQPLRLPSDAPIPMTSALPLRGLEDRAVGGGIHEGGVAGEDATGVARRGRLPLLAPLGEHVFGDEEVERAGVGVNADAVAVLDEADGATD